MKDLSGKVALVTGASRGIGKGVAQSLGERGATVYVTGRTECDDGLPAFLKGTTIHQTAEEVEKLGGIGIAHRCDFSDENQIRELFGRVKREQGRLDILVNSAWAGAKHVLGGYFWNTPFWQQPMAMFDDLCTVGLRSAYLTSQHAAELMSAQRCGLIVNISFGSASHYWITPCHGIFKAATDKMTADIAYELKDYGVKVFSLYPGTVRTEGMVEAARFDPSLKVQEMETPQYVGRCIAALALDENTLAQTGNVLLTADIGKKYGFTDVDGKSPMPFMFPH